MLDPRDGLLVRATLCEGQYADLRVEGDWLVIGCGRAKWDRSWRTGFLPLEALTGLTD